MRCANTFPVTLVTLLKFIQNHYSEKSTLSLAFDRKLEAEPF